MKKKLISLVMVLALLPLSFLFVGCKYKTYEFYGVIAKDNTTIISYEEMEEADKAVVEMFCGSTITLRRDGTSTRTLITYVTTQKDTYYTFTENGRYELEDKSLVFITTLENGKEQRNQQQFVDGKIVYYHDGFLLVYM